MTEPLQTSQVFARSIGFDSEQLSQLLGRCSLLGLESLEDLQKFQTGFWFLQPILGFLGRTRHPRLQTRRAFSSLPIITSLLSLLAIIGFLAAAIQI
jgi:hypothetical protein